MLEHTSVSLHVREESTHVLHRIPIRFVIFLVHETLSIHSKVCACDSDPQVIPLLVLLCERM